MKAVILAAGVGKRLSGADDTPKALLRFGDKSLLQRHIEILAACGVSDVTIVTGHRADAIEGEIARIASPSRIGFAQNPRYREGSIVSLWSARAVLLSGAPCLVMDADVIYDTRPMQRLLSAPNENCFLLDRDVEPGDEPQKLCIRDGVIVDLHKKPTAQYEWYGKSIGFTKFSAPLSAELATALESYIARGKTNVEHEEAFRDLIVEKPPGTFAFEDITGLPWLEIDFADDVARARDVIFPKLTAI